MSNVQYQGVQPKPTKQPKGNFFKKEKMGIKYLDRRGWCSWACMTPDNPILASTKRRGSYSRVSVAVGRRSGWMSSWSWFIRLWLIPCASSTTINIDSHRFTIGTCQYNRAKSKGDLLRFAGTFFEDTLIVVRRDVLLNDLSITCIN